MELDTIPQPELEQLERVGTADVVIGILDGDTPGLEDTAEARMREALAKFSNPLRAVVISNNGIHTAAPAEPAETTPSTVVLACSLPAPVPGETPQQGISNAYRKIFAVGGKLGARACGLAASTPQKSSPQWIYRLIQPVLNLGFDLVAPCYTRQTMEGLLNRSVLAPLHRALYGERLQNPMGPDFGISGKFLQQLLRQDSTRRLGTHVTEGSTLASIAVSAAFGGCQVCESQLGVRSQRPTDWGNLSSLLAEILGAVFVEMEGRAAYWQSIRGSRVLPRFGPPEVALPEISPSLDVQEMHESFQMGTQNLRDVWGLILPPTTLLELRRMSRLSKDQFRFPDQVWARVVYDFALGHRLRVISRDHLLRSFTPLYLGWIASYALEIDSAGVDADLRIEQLSKAFEESKSYLVSRWRWPDRFNP